MSIEYCDCPDCIAAAIERIRQLTKYAVELEKRIRVMHAIMASGADYRSLLADAAKLVKKRDLTGEIRAKAHARDLMEAADARAANKLH